VFGMLADKDVAGVIARLRERIDHWHVGPTPGARGMSAAEAAEALRTAGATSISEHASIDAAYAHALGHAQADARIVVFGSFTTVAAVMQARERQRTEEQQTGRRQ
jgi:dihydrofolate synthase/folylpolyglutamate synthase